MVTNTFDINSFLKYIGNISRRLKYLGPGSYGIINDQFYLRVFRDGSGMELNNILDSDPGEEVKYSYMREADSLKKLQMDYTKLPSICYITITINDIFVTRKK